MKKNNFKKAALLAWSTFGLTLGMSGVMKQPEVVAHAAAIPTGTMIYFKPTDGWLSSGAKMCIYMWNTDGVEIYEEMSIGTSSTVYAFETPTSTKGSFDKIIFARNNPSKPIGWDGRWNQTSDLTYDGTNNLYIIPYAEQWQQASLNDSHWSLYDASTYGLAEIPASTALYVRPDAAFMDDGTMTADRVSAYFYNSDGKNAWVEATAEASGLYKVLSPTLTDGVLPNYVIFVSMKTGTTGSSWENKLEQTADLTPDLTKPVYDVANTSWQGVPTTVTPIATTEGINTNKFRIWLDRNNHYPSAAHQYLLKVGANRYSPTGYEKALVYDVDGIYFPYWDIEIATVKGKEVGLTIVNASNEIQVEVPATTFNEKDNSKLWRVQYDDATSTWSIQKDKIIGRGYASFVGKVLEGYLSCAASVDNGFGAFDLVNDNFIERLDGGTWNVEGNLGDVIINDFDQVADYATGNKTATVDAYSKHQMLQANYIAALGGGGAPFLLKDEQTNSLLLTMMLIFVISLAFGGFMTMRKKRTQA